MRKWITVLFFCGLLPATAAAQGLSVTIGPPAIRWAARPPMVVFAPGMWVVEDSPDEVFFYDGWYWTQQNDHWYRSRDHRGHWGEIERGRVPVSFYAQEPGHYRHFRREAEPRPVNIREARPRPEYERREVRPAHPAYAPQPRGTPARTTYKNNGKRSGDGDARGPGRGANGRGKPGKGRGNDRN